MDNLSPQDLEYLNRSRAKLQQADAHVGQLQVQLQQAVLDRERAKGAVDGWSDFIRERYGLVDGDQISPDGSILRATRDEALPEAAHAAA